VAAAAVAAAAAAAVGCSLLQELACSQLQPWVACLPSSAAVLLPVALPAAAGAAVAMTQQQQRLLPPLLLQQRLQHGHQLRLWQLALLLWLLLRPAQLLLQLPAHARGCSRHHMGLALQQRQQPLLQQQLLLRQQQLHLLHLRHCVTA
jgi:hypothetical protein